MQDLSEPLATEPPQLRFLRILVTVLTGTMILGLLVIIALIVIRFNRPAQVMPHEIALPAGVSATAYTQGPDWYAVVTGENEVLIFNSSNGSLRQRIQIMSED